MRRWLFLYLQVLGIGGVIGLFIAGLILCFGSDAAASILVIAGLAAGITTVCWLVEDFRK